MYDVIDKYIPHKLISSSTFPPWYNTSLKKVLKEKFKFHKKYRTYGNISDYDTFSLLRKRAKLLEAECYKQYLEKCEESIVKAPKMFWSFIKSTRNGSNTLPSSLSYGGQSAESGEDACLLFATYFQSTFLPPSTDQDVQLGAESQLLYSSYTNTINDIEINPETIHKLLKSLDLSKGAGPDRITPLFIIRCSDSLTLPLSILFKRSIKEGIVPKIWKSAFITPIHKSGSRNEVKNYRPISKLCIFAKVFERQVYTQVYNAISSSFTPEQHGFLKNRSTTTNLLSFTDYTTSSMDSGGQVDAIFTDYSKAFDRIDHNLLLEKLLNGYSSAWSFVPSGVPQGSLLGPLLFNIFINNISSCFLHSKFLLYADDMKVFKKIRDITDCILLQQDLNRFENYCSLNKLDLNVTKCYSITFTRKRGIVQFKYKLKEQELKTEEEVKDLGVVHDSKLTYEKHIDYIAKKANRAMGFIIRSSSQFSSIKLIKTLYCSYVRSILEYCSQIWNPQYDVYINRLESIQRRFMKYIQFKCKKYDCNYELRCKRHHILPLYERRRIADVSLLIKIAQSNIDSPDLLSKIYLKVPTRSVRDPTFLLVPHSSTNYRQNSFFVRSADRINNLSEFPDLDMFNSSPNVFRAAITRHWFDATS